MHQYGVRDIEKLLGLPRSTIRALIGAGFVTPARGPRNAWLFSFQDLIVLRTAQALSASLVPNRRITKSLKELRRNLPDEMPLSGLRIAAVGDRVVVKEGDTRWQAEDGQYLLAFEGDPAAGSLSVVERMPIASQAEASRRTRAGRRRCARAQRHERGDRRVSAAIVAEPARLDARTNLGRLLHESGRLAEAEQVYRDALNSCGNDALLLYNFGVLLDDMDRKVEAMAAYQLALQRRSGARGLPLQPCAAVRRARAAEGCDPPHGAVSAARRGKAVALRRSFIPSSSPAQFPLSRLRERVRVRETLVRRPEKRSSRSAPLRLPSPQPSPASGRGGNARASVRRRRCRRLQCIARPQQRTTNNRRQRREQRADEERNAISARQRGEMIEAFGGTARRA